MATQKKTWKELFGATAKASGGTEIGKFKESTGGGTPMAKGQKIDHVADTPKEADEYRKNHPGALVRVSQPRDKDGQFTYNSANKKELEYGPSRGKTIPPFLKGVTLTFAKKSGKGSFVGVDGKKYKLPENITTAEEFVKAFTEHTEGEGFGKFGKIEDTAVGKGGKTGKTISLGYGQFMSSYPKKNIKKNPQQSVFKKPMAASPTPNTETSDGNPFAMATSNLGAFKQKYANEIKEISNIIQDAGYNPDDILTDELWQDLPEMEDTKNFDDLKKHIEDALK